MKTRRIVIAGGGAAGFFAAIAAAETDPRAEVVLLERGSRFLGKVKISGGGRCNVTHACFDTSELSEHYPRGRRELRAAFHHWQPRDTMAWFEQRGVALKTEEDGRVFPVSDDSQTVIDCLLAAARDAGVRLETRRPVESVEQIPRGFILRASGGDEFPADRVMLAPGSLKNSPLLESLQALGHSIEPLAPSLFALNVKDPRIQDLAGISVPSTRVGLPPGGRPQSGPLLITHRGVSGPAVLKLSAWEARRFQELDYRGEIALSWLGDSGPDDVRALLDGQRESQGRRAVKNAPVPRLPARLWERLVSAAGVPSDLPWARLSRNQANALLGQLTDARFAVSGKTMNKEEFVTCGGVRLREVDFRTMESRVVPGLHFGGECLDLDGVTGGFNFQAAWTTGRLAGLALAKE